MAAIPVVTALYASVNALLNIALAARVVRHRGKSGVSIGAGDSKELALAIRIHSNNAEFVPLALLMMLLAELCNGASMYLHLAGGVLFVARIFHVVGMPKKAPNPWRVGGVVGTWGLIIVLAFWTLWLRRGA